MSRIDDLAETIHGLSDKIDEAANEAGATAQEAEEAVALAEFLGDETVLTTLDQVKDHLDALAAELKGAAVQANGIQTFVVALGQAAGGGEASGSTIVPAASRDPAAVPNLSPQKPRSSRGAGRKRLAALTEQAESPGDIASFAEKTGKGLADSFKDIKPPEITGTGTRTQDSPPMMTPTASAGADVSSAANGVATVTLLLVGGKHAFQQIRRGISAEEQKPEEITPSPRERYPWEDEPRSGTR
ncbi:hypothetical protein Kisp01_51680 [Kineosporia sp. NBRC 101677]|uniref:hypothetical protein n=1 Tax=Kineosporia sp. NBRC 101677 TaxID=3032197 RepID=UPI0024A44038|nr:hypothetical protein [Kineosporia sp. NBRC 101677]GLY18154.1 hypothetical protein Kisp01_51680 [Kineosporia sp. NBRC 101677]